MGEAHLKAIGEPTIGISLQIPLAKDGTTLVLQSLIARDCEPQHLNALLDKIQKAGSRQQAKSELPNLKIQLANSVSQLEAGVTQLNNIDEMHRNEQAGRRGELRLNPKQQQDRNNVQTNQKRLQDQIALLEKTIKEAEELIG